MFTKLQKNICNANHISIYYIKFVNLNFSRMKKVLCLLLSFVCYTLCINAQVCYSISGNGLDKPSYLFGTHHLAPLKVFTENNGAVVAFDQSNQIVGEIDLTIDQMELAMKLQPFMIAPSDSVLSKILTAEEYESAVKAFPELSPQPGLSLQMLDMLKPAAISQTIMVPLMTKYVPDYNPTEQLDSYFLKQGQSQGKKIIGLETPEFQADVLFNSTSLKSQAEDLLESLLNPNKVIEEMEILNNAYFSQDMNLMYQLSKDMENEPILFERLLKNRNLAWMEKLPDIIKNESTFIAVGCLHLVGEFGLINLLRNEGYKVEPVK